MNKPKFASWALAILASPLLINLTYGQTTPTAAPTAETTDAGSTDLLKLDDFIVTSDAASGYRATSSTSATGIGTPTGDTPASIFIVTKDFISDNRLDLINDAVRYVPGVITAPNNESQPFIRGFQGAYSLRNGVFVRQNLLTWDVSDVEVIEGASSIFYSNIRPGGILNYNTIKPVLGQTFTDLTQDFGSYEYRRTEAAFNYGTNDFAFRLDLGSSDQYTFRVGNNERQTFFDASVLWKITTNQALTIEYAVESVYRANGWSAFITPLTNTRYWQNPAAIASGLSVSAWMAKNYPGVPVYNEYAPFSPSIGDPYGRITPIITNYQSGMDKPLDVNYTAKILDNLVFDVVLNYNWEDNEGTNPNPADPLANGTFAGFNEQRFINIRDSYNANTRLTYRLNVAKTENTLMVGNDNQWAIKRMPSVSSLNIPTNGNPPTVSSNNQQTASFTYNPVTMGTLNGAALLALPTTNNFNSVQDSAQHFGGTYLVDQAVLFNKSLYLILGDRYATFLQHVYYNRNPTLEAAAPPDAVAKKWTPELGALYKIPGTHVSVYGTYSESIIPQTQIDASGQAVEPIDAKGFDVGAKMDFLDGMLTGTVDYYAAKESNTAVANSAENVANGLPANATYGYYTYGNPLQVRGLQADLNWNITKDDQLVFGVNEFLQADYVAPNSNSTLVGVPIAYQPDTTYNIWNRYQFSGGPLAGLVLGAGLLHNSEASYGGDFNHSQLYIPGYTIGNAMVGYDFRALGHRVRVQLLCKNISDKIYRDGAGGFFNDPRTFDASASVRF